MEAFQLESTEAVVAHEPPQAECSPPSGLESGTTTTPGIDQAFERRRQRILDHRLEALENPDTLMACISGVNSDMLDCELKVSEIFRQVIGADGASIDELERHAGLIDLLLRLSKQVTQLSQLELSARRKEKPEPEK